VIPGTGSRQWRLTQIDAKIEQEPRTMI